DGYEAKKETLESQKVDKKTKVEKITADNMFKDIEDEDEETDNEDIMADDSEVTDEVDESDESDEEK
ncbi:MAG: hypothetical protein DRP35_03020, partial [Candidatus Zixiibacteriota bacterium]